MELCYSPIKLLRIELIRDFLLIFFFYFILRAKLRHRFDMDDDTFFCSDACSIYRLTCFNFQQMRRIIFPISNESRA